jgi:hypothetical protein
MNVVDKDSVAGLEWLTFLVTNEVIAFRDEEEE